MLPDGKIQFFDGTSTIETDGTFNFDGTTHTVTFLDGDGNLVSGVLTGADIVTFDNGTWNKSITTAAVPVATTTASAGNGYGNGGISGDPHVKVSSENARVRHELYAELFCVPRILIGET